LLQNSVFSSCVPYVFPSVAADTPESTYPTPLAIGTYSFHAFSRLGKIYQQLGLPIIKDEFDLGQKSSRVIMDLSWQYLNLFLPG